MKLGARRESLVMFDAQTGALVRGASRTAKPSPMAGDHSAKVGVFGNNPKAQSAARRYGQGLANMPWEPKPEVVDVMAKWLFHKENPDVLDWEADEKAAEPAKPVSTAKEPDIRSEYEARARQMLLVARRNSGSGG